jgi:hypothetical protein
MRSVARFLSLGLLPAIGCIGGNSDPIPEYGGPGSELGFGEALAIPEPEDCPDTSTEEFLPAIWTVEVGVGSDFDGSWQLTSVPVGSEAGVVYVTPEHFGRLRASGQVSWQRETPADLDEHELHFHGTDQIVGMARYESEFLELVVFDADDGEVVEVISLGEIGADGVGNFAKQNRHFFVTARHEQQGVMLLHLDESLEVVDEHALGFAVEVPFVETEFPTVNLLFGVGPSRIIGADGELIADLGNLPELQGVTNPDALVSSWENISIGGQVDGRLSLRWLDRQGEPIWTATRTRGSLESGAQAVDGSVVVGWEQVGDVPESTLDRQPLIIQFDQYGEMEWVDRIAVTGSAERVSGGPGGEVYVAGIAEVVGQGVQLETTGWIRRYEPPGFHEPGLD